ncbi:hypothetical protein HDR59_02775 [bacterium]|nr:hypothetical protein [bacterium]
MVDFNKVVKLTEKYIEKNAFPILKLLKPMNTDSVEKYISKYYKPDYNMKKIEKLSEKDLKLAILNKMCHELQNYQAMPRAINYSFNKNKICEIVKSKYDNKTRKKLYDLFREEFSFKEKFYDEYLNDVNFAWKKYSNGLEDTIKFLKKKRNTKDVLLEILSTQNKDISNCKLKKSIKGLGDALTRDFLKEFCRDDLIKDDIHIKVIGKEVLEIKNGNKFVETFLNLCKDNNYVPYYIDKIFWLCCTGNFYKHEVIITSFNRDKFIDYLNKNLNK